MAETAGKAMFGIFGVTAMEESGKIIVAENAIEDPATTVSRELLAAAERRYGVVAASMAPVPIDTTDTTKRRGCNLAAPRGHMRVADPSNDC